MDKFHYLSSLLEGPASAAIARLKLTAPNYDEAFDTLTKRYSNVQLIIDQHMDTLLQLEPTHHQRMLRRSDAYTTNLNSKSEA